MEQRQTSANESSQESSSSMACNAAELKVSDAIMDVTVSSSPTILAIDSGNTSARIG